MTELESFGKWLSRQDSKTKFEFVDMLNLIKEASDKKLTLGITINVSPLGEVKFDSGKTSLSTLKKLVLRS
jgi:hypothetical protein